MTKMSPNCAGRPQGGLTLIELMVALVMGLVLLAGVVTVFVANKQTYKFQDSLARLQENGRFAVEILARDIRQSGYTGCAGQAAKIKNTLNNAGSVFWSLADAVRGYQANDTGLDLQTVAGTSGSWTPNLDLNMFGNLGTSTAILPIANTDVITVVLADAKTCVVDKHNPESATFFLTPCDLDVGDIVMVSDCSNSAILQITQTNGLPKGGSDKTLVVHNQGNDETPGNYTQKLDHNYARNGALYKVAAYTYYVGNTGRSVAGVPVLALYRVNISTATRVPEELVEGVENMQILYGLDADENGAVDNYVTADKVGTSWANVRSVRLSLRLRSPDPKVLPAEQGLTTSFNGDENIEWTAIKDSAWRQVFTTTVGVRNRSS
jgi:type IV pilus assembly protein PilW